MRLHHLQGVILAICDRRPDLYIEYSKMSIKETNVLKFEIDEACEEDPHYGLLRCDTVWSGR